MNKIYIPFFYEVDLDEAVNFTDEEESDDEDLNIVYDTPDNRYIYSGVYDVCENEDNSFLSFANQFWELCEYEELFEDN